MASDTESFDFIVVGGGTAGLVLASRIAETPALGRVLVVEAGKDQTQDPRVNVPAFWPTLISTGSDWRFKTVSQVSRHILGSLSHLSPLLRYAAKLHFQTVDRFPNIGWLIRASGCSTSRPIAGWFQCPERAGLCPSVEGDHQCLA